MPRPVSVLRGRSLVAGLVGVLVAGLVGALALALADGDPRSLLAGWLLVLGALAVGPVLLAVPCVRHEVQRRERHRRCVDHLVEAAAAGRVLAERGWTPVVEPGPEELLPAELTLDRLVGPLVRVRGRGLSADGPVGMLRVPLGVAVPPGARAPQVFTVDLRRAGGHVGVTGPQSSGRSVALATLVTSLAVTHTPEQVQVLCLDLATGALDPLATLPHVGAVAPRHRPDQLAAVVARVDALLERREHLGPGATAGDVVLVVDGWSVLAAEHADLAAAVTGIATRGSAHRVHVVLASPAWTDLPPALVDLLATRLELQRGGAGRGTTADGLSVQVAEPRVRLADGGAPEGEMLSLPALGAALRASASREAGAPAGRREQDHLAVERAGPGRLHGLDG